MSPKSKGQRNQFLSLSTGIWWLLGLLTALGIAAYWNSFDVPFVFDDFVSIQRNFAVRSEYFNWNLLSLRAVLYLTFTFNYWWTGQAVWSYHLVNLAMHVINGVLLFFIGLRVFRQVDRDEQRCRLYAFVAASFFLLHPLQTESVTYISSRSELLSTGFYLAGFLLFVEYPVQKIGFLLTLLVAVPFVLALGSKETAISLPAAIFLYDFIFLSGGSLKPMFQRWRFYIGFIGGGVAAVVYILTVTLKGAVGVGLAAEVSPYQYFLTQLRVVVRYASMIVVPIRQNLDHDITISHTIFEPAVFVSLLLLVSLAMCAWMIRKREPVIAFAIFWFFLTLSPTSSFVPIPDLIFEHRLYLPLAGVCLAFPVLMALLQRQVRERFNIQLKYGVYAALPLVLLLTATILRNQVWRDEVRLWADAVSKSPQKSRSQYSLATAYFKQGRYDEAIRGLKQAIKDSPATQKSVTDILGNLYLQTGRYDEAIQVFSTAAQDPVRGTAAKAYNNLGLTYLYKWQQLQSQQGKMAPEAFAREKEIVLGAAHEAYRHCLELDPSVFTALHSYINVSYNLGLADQLTADAENQLKSGEALNPLYTLAYIAFLRQDYQRASEQFDQIESSLGVNIDRKLIFFNHAYALSALQQKDSAIAKYLQALQLDPVFLEAHVNVGLLYKEKGDYSKAADNFSEVLHFDPNNVLSNLGLAEIAGVQGDKDSARRYLTTVLHAQPDNQEALRTWKQLGL